jgi:diguanylate cyclase (GGDEF)-like protein
MVKSVMLDRMAPLAKLAAITGLITLGILAALEAFKSLYFPEGTSWPSHGLAIFFIVGLSLAIALRIGRRVVKTDAELEAVREAGDGELGRRRRFRRMTELLQVARTREEVAEILRAHLAHVLPDLSGTVYLFSASRDVVEPLASWGSSRTQPSEFSVDDCWALRLGKPYDTSEGGNVMRCGHREAASATDQVCIPLLADGKTLGVLTVRAAVAGPSGVPSAGSVLPPLESVAALADLLALPLANVRLQETLRNPSIRDGLTGVYNRRYMEESLAREISRSARRGNSLSVVQIDIDFFKRLNDAHGQAVGDAFLRAAGSFLNTKVRGEDVACRYGGDEFALILPDATGEVALEIVERIRAAFALLQVETPAGGRASTTFSAGVATFPTDGHSSRELLVAADRALYQAKTAGKDRVLLVQREATSEAGAGKVPHPAGHEPSEPGC